MGSWRPTTRAVFLVLLAITTKQRKMEKFQSEEFKQNFERNEKGYSIIQAVLGGIMIAIGHLWADECPNDAAYWLFVAGICLVVLNSINGWSKMYKQCAEKDGVITCGEKFGMGLNSFASGAMTIVDFAMLIWGSVVVFGAYSTWTYDEADVAMEEYCAYTPYMTAFIILLLKWILVPAMIILTCFCACCCACCCAACAPKDQNQS